MTKARFVAIVAALFVTEAASADPPDAKALAKRIDARLAADFAAKKIEPAPTASDAEFLRRVHLDLTGRIPRVSEVHAFLDDPAADKRERLIDRLLDQPRFAVHFANVWRAALLPELTANQGAGQFQPGFDAWLRERLRARVGYDVFVRELIDVPIGATGDTVLREPDRPNPLAFFAVKEAKPEHLAAAVTRTFLGIQLECAQCHNHPFAKWKQEQFWAQAAFFAGVERQGNTLFAPIAERVGRSELTMPTTKTKLAARFLDDAEAPKDRGGRRALAEWIVRPGNPYFARAAVNRIWGQMFGVGIVEPVDDFRDDNPPADPELLDDLARDFADSGLDLRHVIRAICLSQAYQRTSRLTDASQNDTRLPARMSPKALTAEQMFDSLVQATGYREEDDKGSSRRQLLARFSLTGPIGEPETSVQQALTLRNGRFVAWATDPEKCPTLLAACRTPGMTERQRIEVLYLATLSRMPTPAEQERLAAHRSSLANRGEAEFLADVLWTLLNTAEFRLNH
jgi:Protein of unknown function (DUF1553)/Protein of unknown function (DUF1549)